MAALRYATYNCKNFRRTLRHTFISELFYECDFLCLQEHWLLNSQFHMFNNIVSDSPICYESKSPMDEEVQKYGRPYGGVAILWRSNIKYNVVPVVTTSSRMCCIQIWVSDSDFIMLFSVYMPCDVGSSGNISVFQDILSEISVICSRHSAVNVVIAGDLNTDLSRERSLHTKELLNFCASENISTCHTLLPSIPYSFQSSHGQSLIDHILISDNMKDALLQCSSFDNVNNGSDHNALICKLDIACIYLDHTKANYTPKTAWYKASLVDIERYRTQLDVKLDSICVPYDALACRNMLCTKHTTQINTFYSNIVDCCLKASEILPQSKCKTGSAKCKAGWNDICKAKKNTALFWHNMWKSAGRPREGYISRIRRSVRADYHRAVKYVKRNESKLKSEQLVKALLENKSRDFWSEIKRFKGKSSHIPHIINGTSGDKPIAEEFARKFNVIFNSVGYSVSSLTDIKNHVHSDINNMSLDAAENSLVDVSDLYTIIKNLKKGKTDGNLGLYSDHIICGTDKLMSYIALLFNSMLIHGSSPENMCVGTMVPIPKGKRLNLSNSDNFRGICLQSLLCKLLDMFMLKRESSNLSTSHLQFGFKEKLSSSMATAIVTETIDYYQAKGGSVYALALDATKAFDRVEYCELFRVLMKRGFNPLYTRLLLQMYVNQSIRVKFNGTHSDYFNVTNGVKQGGVISPTLFTCYIDDMLQRLEKSKLGCHVGSQYVGCVSYADDLILLAPTIAALKGMVKICEDFATEYSIKFNGSKCNLLVFDKNKSDFNCSINISGETANNVSSLKYLGHVLVNNRQDPHVDTIRKDFAVKTNTFLGDLSCMSTQIKVDLFNTYCMSLYGSHLCDFENIQPLYTEWRKAVRRILKVPYRTHSKLLCHIARIIPPDVCIQQRFINFFYSGLRSSNDLVSYMFKNSICNNTRLGSNLRVICNIICKSNCDVLYYDPSSICKELFNSWFKSCDEKYIRNGAQIGELIFMRDTHEKCILNERECNVLISSLCTDDVC